MAGTICRVMRKRWLSLLLPLVMLLAQQAGLRHEIGHFDARPGAVSEVERGAEPAAAAGTGSPAANDRAADKVCELCLAFASIAAAAHPTLPPLTLAATSDLRQRTEPVASRLAPALAARSRGPPELSV
jgi:hypothetical protein